MTRASTSPRGVTTPECYVTRATSRAETRLGELAHLEAGAILATAVVAARVERTPVVLLRRLRQAEAARRLAEQEIREVVLVAHLQHRHGEIAPLRARVQPLP